MMRNPPRSKWAIALYVVAIFSAIFAVFDGFHSITADVYPDAEERNFEIFSMIVNRAIPAVIIAVIGGAVQYLADIRWAMLKRLEGDDA